MRKIKDAQDLETNELIYLRGHAKATYMSDGRSVEDAINGIPQGGGGSVDISNKEDKALLFDMSVVEGDVTSQESTDITSYVQAATGMSISDFYDAVVAGRKVDLRIGPMLGGDCHEQSRFDYGNSMMLMYSFLPYGANFGILVGRGLCEFVYSTAGFATMDDVNDALEGKVEASALATVATSGSYNDLSDKPVIKTERDVVNIDATTTSVNLVSNKYYVRASSNFNLQISLAAPADSTIVNEYVIQFTVGLLHTLTMPADIKWANGIAPELTKGKTYVISIINNLAVFAEF